MSLATSSVVEPKYIQQAAGKDRAYGNPLGQWHVQTPDEGDAQSPETEFNNTSGDLDAHPAHILQFVKHDLLF